MGFFFNLCIYLTADMTERDRQDRESDRGMACGSLDYTCRPSEDSITEKCLYETAISETHRRGQENTVLERFLRLSTLLFSK